MPRSAVGVALSSMLPADPARWAARRLGVYLSTGLLVAGVAGVAGVVPGSPVRALLAASYQRSAAASRGAAAEDVKPDTPLAVPSAAPSPLPDLMGREIASQDAKPEAVQAQAGNWAVQFGAFESWAEASRAGRSASQGIGAGSVTVSGRIRNGRSVYVAELGGLTGAQAAAACELDIRRADTCSVLTAGGRDTDSQP